MQRATYAGRHSTLNACKMQRCNLGQAECNVRHHWHEASAVVCLFCARARRVLQYASHFAQRRRRAGAGPTCGEDGFGAEVPFDAQVVLRVVQLRPNARGARGAGPEGRSPTVNYGERLLICGDCKTSAMICTGVAKWLRALIVALNNTCYRAVRAGASAGLWREPSSTSPMVCKPPVGSRHRASATARALAAVRAHFTVMILIIKNSMSVRGLGHALSLKAWEGARRGEPITK